MYIDGNQEVRRVTEGEITAMMTFTKTEADDVGFANFLWGKAMKGV